MIKTFTNHIGQVINEGDEVIVVTTGYSHSVDVRKGIFLGVQESGGVQYLGEFEEWIWIDTRTGKNEGWYANIDPKFREYKKTVVKRKSTLQLNRVYKIA